MQNILGFFFFYSLIYGNAVYMEGKKEGKKKSEIYLIILSYKNQKILVIVVHVRK